MSTNYTLFAQVDVDGEFTSTEFTRATKSTVVAAAEAYRVENKVAVEVRTAAGTTVFSLSRPKQRVVTRFTKPFTKTVTLREGTVPDGYVAAYERPQNHAAVLRNEDAEDESRYAVMDTATSTLIGYAATTRAAGALMKAHRLAKA